MSKLSELVGSGISGILTGASGIIDQFVTDPDKKLEAELKLKELDYQAKVLELESKKIMLEDTASARSMQVDTKSKVPFILTILFTVGYFGLTAFMLYFLLGKLDVELSQFVTVFISTIFGAFNAIMVQIISFYFGSSNGGEQQGHKIIEAFNSANKKAP